MKVGILVTIISGFGKKGFYHSQEIGLGKAMTELGHDVTIYKCVSKENMSDPMTLGDHLRVQYIPVRAVGVHGYFPTERLDTGLKGLLCFADTQIFLPHVYRFCEKHRICFVPYIGIAHSFQKNMKSRVMDFLFSLGTLPIYRRIPLLAKTDEARRELLSLGVKDCGVAPVGLDESELNLDFEKQDRAAIRAEYGFAPDDVIISFVARLKPEKRPVDLVDILSAVRGQKKFKLLVVGEGPLRQQMDEKIDALHLNGDVKIIDRVPYENMWKIHYLSDYFLNLREGEIFGMALMEGVFYLSSVAAMHGPGPDLILEGLKGHTLCENDEEIKAWLLKPLPDIQDLRQSAQVLLDRFSWRICAQAFEDRITAYQSGKTAEAKQVSA